MGMKNIQVEPILTKSLLQMCAKIFYVISYLILSQINLMKCTLNYEISIKELFILTCIPSASSANDTMRAPYIK